MRACLLLAGLGGWLVAQAGSAPLPRLLQCSPPTCPGPWACRVALGLPGHLSHPQTASISPMAGCQRPHLPAWGQVLGQEPRRA